ncbi:MAG: helix-hairpin-helix domain-containing protein [Bacteroidota bacterium]|jgi:DNA uptake protein ComE-like DNA-binding protein|nr:helix-hairpin-helix domain-containing protein [Bacteroidota bacterium]
MLKKARYWFRNVFGFSRTETNGAIVLIMLMILMFIILPLIKMVNFSSNAHSISDKVLLDSMVAEYDKNNILPDALPVAATPPEYFIFDPNVVPEETFISFGVSKKVAARIINFRNKGGKFGIKSDLLKIYDFPEEKYEELHPFIDLPEKKAPPTIASPKPREFVTDFSSKKDKIAVPFDINKADTSQLKALKGIGSVLSNRVLKYRSSLGGFISKDQLKEIYGLEDQALQHLMDNVNIEPDFEPVKINVNTADVKQLASHPYISRKLAERIVAYREHHGLYSKENSLYDLKELDEDTKEKINPYLEF